MNTWTQHHFIPWESLKFFFLLMALMLLNFLVCILFWEQQLIVVNYFHVGLVLKILAKSDFSAGSCSFAISCLKTRGEKIVIA
jgi:hypothetical protein